jgi:integrase
VSKTGKARRIDLSREALAAIGEPGADLVFGSRKYGMSRRQGFHMIRRVFKTTLKAAGLPMHLSPHCLRHTYASLLISHGAPITYVQRQLGHSDIKMTVHTYGSHLPMHAPEHLDKLDAIITKAHEGRS